METGDLKVKILGIVATPIKGGNCQYLVEQALLAAQELGGVETEVVHLQDYHIEFCKGCDGCMRRINKIEKELGRVRPVPVKEYNCGINNDDMPILHRKLVECDGLIVGAPSYLHHIPGQLRVFIDRCRTFVHDYRLQYKVGGAVGVAFYRNAGQETLIDDINGFFLAVKMSVVSFGARTVSTREGSGTPIKDKRFAVADDAMGMDQVQELGARVAEMARTVKAGRLALAPRVETAQRVDALPG